jgi:DNA-binding transcriptional LysR family regulator
LERSLGTSLLDRSSRHVKLTPAGEVLLIEGRRLLNQAGQTVRAVRDSGRERLTVGFYGSAASSLLTDVLRVFGDARADADVTLLEMELSRVDDILDGRVDVAFTRLRPGESAAEVEVLAAQPRMVVVHAGHPLAERERVHFADLVDESFITQPAANNSSWRAQWLAEQRRHGLPGRIAGEATSVQEILTLVATGRGVCLVPAPAAQLYPRDDVRYLEVTDAEPSVVSLAWDPDNLRPVVQDFIQAARSVAAAA